MRLLAALALFTQLPEPIRVTSRLVEVNVVARDKNGPVAGLTQGDFILRRSPSPSLPGAKIQSFGFIPTAPINCLPALLRR